MPKNLTKIQKTATPARASFRSFPCRSGAVRPRSILAISIGFACSSCALQAVKPAAPVVPPAFEQAVSRSAPWPDGAGYHGVASEELDSLGALAQHHSPHIFAPSA